MMVICCGYIVCDKCVKKINLEFLKEQFNSIDEDWTAFGYGKDVVKYLIEKLEGKK